MPFNLQYPPLEFEWMWVALMKFILCQHSSELQGFRKRGTAAAWLAHQSLGCRDQQSQGRPGAEAWQNTTLQLSAPPALPSLARSADIDPLNANETLFSSMIAWIRASHYEIFLNDHSQEEGRGYLTVSWVALLDIDFTLPCFMGMKNRLLLKIKINHDFPYSFLFRTLHVLCLDSINIFCRV